MVSHIGERLDLGLGVTSGLAEAIPVVQSGRINFNQLTGNQYGIIQRGQLVGKIVRQTKNEQAKLFISAVDSFIQFYTDKVINLLNQFPGVFKKNLDLRWCSINLKQKNLKKPLFRDLFTEQFNAIGQVISEKKLPQLTNLLYWLPLISSFYSLCDPLSTSVLPHIEKMAVKENLASMKIALARLLASVAPEEIIDLKELWSRLEQPDDFEDFFSWVDYYMAPSVAPHKILPELREHIASFLHPRDLRALSKTNQSWRTILDDKPRKDAIKKIGEVKVFLTDYCSSDLQKRILSTLECTLSEYDSLSKAAEAMKRIEHLLPWLIENTSEKNLQELKAELNLRGLLHPYFGELLDWIEMIPSFQKTFAYFPYRETLAIKKLFDEAFILEKVNVVKKAANLVESTSTQGGIKNKGTPGRSISEAKDALRNEGISSETVVKKDRLPWMIEFIRNNPSQRRVLLTYCIAKILIEQGNIHLAEEMANLIPKITDSFGPVWHEIPPHLAKSAACFDEGYALAQFAKVIKDLATFDILMAKGLRQEGIAFCKTVLQENGEYFSFKGKLYLTYFFKHLLEREDLAGALDLAEFCKRKGFIKQQTYISDCVAMLLERNYLEESIALHEGIVETGRNRVLSFLWGKYSDDYRWEYNTNFKDFYNILLRLVESDQWDRVEEVIQWFPDTERYETDKRSKYLQEAVEYLMNNNDLAKAHRIASFIPDNTIRENCMKKIEKLG